MLAMSACPLASATTLSRWADVKVTWPGHSRPVPTVVASRLDHPDRLSALLRHDVRVGGHERVEAPLVRAQ